MSDLIERLRAATCQDRELDAEIFWLTNKRKAESIYWTAATGLPKSLPDKRPTKGLGALAIASYAPFYTSSLDAAKDLVPDGMRWGCSRSQEPTEPQMPKYHGWVMPLNSCLADDEFEAYSEADAAIALTIAALLAKGVG